LASLLLLSSTPQRYYSSKHIDNAVMATNASIAWASSNGYGRWTMFGGVAGAAAAGEGPGGSVAPTGSPDAHWTELVSFFSDAMQDWMIVANGSVNATRWMQGKGYVRQRGEGVFVSSSATAVVGYGQAVVQYWKASINDTALAGTPATAAELLKQGYVELWVEGYGARSAAPPPPPGPPKPPPPPPPPPKPAERFMCFGGPPGAGVCVKSTLVNATHNDSLCGGACPPAPVPPKQPSAYAVPAQQFGFVAIPLVSADGKESGEPGIM